MSPPTKELMKLTLEKRIAHGGHPVLRWMMDNIFIRTDPAGNIKADKEKSTEKIDGAIATIMEVTLEEAKTYLRVTSSDEDDLIRSLITAAEKQVQDITRQSDEEFMANEERALIRIRIAVLYTVAYLYEHREEADHHAGKSYRSHHRCNCCPGCRFHLSLEHE